MVRVWRVDDVPAASSSESTSGSEPATTDESIETPELSEDADEVEDFEVMPSLLPERPPEDELGSVVKAMPKKQRVFWFVWAMIRYLVVEKLFGGRSLKPTLVHAVTFLTCFVAGTAGSLLGVIISVARPSRAADIVENWTIAKLEQVVLAIARSASDKASLAAALAAQDTRGTAGTKATRVPAIGYR